MTEPRRGSGPTGSGPVTPWGSEPERQSNFYGGFLFLSGPKREALRAVYRFCRHMDDIVDSGNLRPEEAQRMLDFWREELRRTYAGTPTHSLSAALVPHLGRFGLGQQPFLDVISGVEMDLRRSRYQTFSELEPYLHGVAVAVGLLCVEIFGYGHTPPDAIGEYARHMGYAFQLTNILRDVGTDLERGRIYLPLDEIQAAGYSVEALIRRQADPAFRTLMERQYERAKTHYRRARNILHPADRVSMIPGEVMARIYEELLETMRADGFRVFFTRYRLTPWRKARVAASAVGACYGFV